MVNPFLTVKEILQKLGGDKISGKKYVLPETKVEPSEHTTAFGINGCFLLPVFTLEEGKGYKVVVDGLAMEHLVINNHEQFIGNPYLYSGHDNNNGKPWLVVIAPNLGVCAVAFLDPAENEKSHTVAVYEETETIVPIDQKYLPYDGEGVRIPHVLCGEGYILSKMEYLTVTDDPVFKTYEKLEYAANKNLPILFNIMVDFGDGFQAMGLLMHLQQSHDREHPSFFASVGPILLNLARTGSGDQYSWEFSHVTL